MPDRWRRIRQRWSQHHVISPEQTRSAPADSGQSGNGEWHPVDVAARMTFEPEGLACPAWVRSKLSPNIRRPSCTSAKPSSA
jgi:hypothetical protein